MRTFEEYKEGLLKMRPNLYLGSERIDRSHPCLEGGIRVIRETFDAPANQDLKELVVVNSHLTGRPINRFCHIHQSIDDLLKKQQMTRALCHRAGGCIQRCMGIDALNALSVITYEMDMHLGTDSFQKFREYMKYFQEKDLVASCAQTDAKGDRLKRPHEQRDPDVYVRVIENLPRGIVVRGAKLNITNTPYADEIIVLPTRFMTPKDSAYAVAFAIPADHEGVKILVRPAYHHRRKRLSAPISEIGDGEAFIIFDDVFVPHERVFLNAHLDPRQTAYAGFLALLFAHYHRHTYTGCKPAISEIFASAAALMAEYNGIENESHVKEKLSQILGTAELVYAAGQASAYRAERSPSGTFIPDEILTNAGRRLAGQEIYNEFKILADIAGGIVATLPFEESFYHPEVGDLALKYLRRNPRIDPENVHRCVRGIENLIVSDLACVVQLAGLHGGGSPQMETITMMSRYDIQRLKGIATYLFGITPELEVYERKTVTPRDLLERYRRLLGIEQKERKGP